MQRILLSLSVVVFVGALVIGATGAFFSDEETSTGNTFTAGSIDLRVDSVAHYNGLVCFNDEWVPEDAIEWNSELEVLELKDGVNLEDALNAFIEEHPGHYPEPGSECGGTWELTDLGPEHTFFNYRDLKPGDSGENTISLHLETNDGYMCAIIDNMEDEDNGCTEPEAEDGDTTCDDVAENEGELADELHFFAWSDDGDNIFEQDETALFSNEEGPASDVIDGVVYPMFTPQSGALLAGTTTYIGMYWCFGDIDVDGTTLSCDGESSTNIAQTDSLTADITFYVEQARNNEDFECPEIGELPDPNPTLTGTSTLTLLKEVIGDEQGGEANDNAFDLEANGPEAINGKEGDEDITDAEVPAGVYTLEEGNGPAGYDLTDISCTVNGSDVAVGFDGDSAALTLEDGDIAICTFTNTEELPV